MPKKSLKDKYPNHSVSVTMQAPGGPEVPLPTGPSPKVKKLAEAIDKLPYPGKILTKIAVARANNDDKALEAAFAEGKQMLQDAGMMETEEDHLNTLTNIRDLDLRIWTTKGRIKTQQEVVDDIKAGHTAYSEMIKAKQLYETAREKLRVALLSDRDYNDAMENLAEEKVQLNEDKEVLSLHIVEYYTRTHERQVEIGDKPGDARELVVTGKLGARGKYQTNLFGGQKDEPKPEQEKLV